MNDKNFDLDPANEANTGMPQREYASVWIRLAAIVIDGLLLVPFYIPVFFMTPDPGSTADPGAGAPILMLLLSLGMIVFAIWNTMVRMGKTGQSLGRKFLDIAVLDKNGNPIGIGKAVFRETIGRFLSGIVCYIGYLNAFWDKDSQMWHDKLADCFVYYVEGNFS